jgi:hypothetical protein
MSYCKSAATGKDKVAHMSEAEAVSACTAQQEGLRKRGDTEWQLLNAYVCDSCGYWHVGRSRFKTAVVVPSAVRPRREEFTAPILPFKLAASSTEQPTRTAAVENPAPPPKNYAEHTAAQAFLQAAKLIGWAAKLTAVAVLRKASKRVSKLADEIESRRA